MNELFGNYRIVPNYHSAHRHEVQLRKVLYQIEAAQIPVDVLPIIRGTDKTMILVSARQKTAKSDRLSDFLRQDDRFLFAKPRRKIKPARIDGLPSDITFNGRIAAAFKFSDFLKQEDQLSFAQSARKTEPAFKSYQY